MVRIFIDPAGRSTGWAIFNDTEYVESGTIAVQLTKEEDKLKGDDRLVSALGRIRIISIRYYQLLSNLGYLVEEAFIERLMTATSIHCHWAVGSISSALYSAGVKRVSPTISVTSWQKEVDWKGKRGKLKPWIKMVDSEDELAAIGMGLYYVTANL
jgi:Holliday junction resolvasome RuvABC endonuclease subunit